MAAGDLTDAERRLVGPLLPPERGRPGQPALDNRTILDGILWRAREGARWRAVPERYGKWNTVWRRFARWRDLVGLFEALFAALAGSGAAEERLQMLDSTVIRAHHRCAAGATILPRSGAGQETCAGTRPEPKGAGRSGAGPFPDLGRRSTAAASLSDDRRCRSWVFYHHLPAGR